MRYHHTKSKGDIGVHAAIFDLRDKGWDVFLPLSEHLAYDLVVQKDGLFLRVQVKYRAAKNGVIDLRFSTCWADRHGVHTSPVNKEDVDLFCVYSPETRRCYYVDPRAHRLRATIRLAPPKNGQTRGVWLADSLLDIPVTVLGRAA